MSRFVPNPSCCTDPRYLCPRCSTAACEAAGGVANAQVGIPLRQKVDPDDVLPTPTIDWTLNQSHPKKHADCGCSKTSHATDVREEYPEDILPTPKMIW